jgi:hypothetical protein
LRKLITPPTLKSIAKTSRETDVVFVSRGNVSNLLWESRRRRKGRVKHEDVYQAETAVFGTPAAGYQVQFLKRLVITTSKSKETGLTVPIRVLPSTSGTETLARAVCAARRNVRVRACLAVKRQKAKAAQEVPSDAAAERKDERKHKL